MVTNIQIRGKLKYYSKPYGRQWKWRYQVHGHIVEPKLHIPKALQGVKIIDPLHPETIPKPELPKWVPPRRHPLLENFFPQPTIRDHPNYHDQPIKRFNRTIKFHAGIDQVCLLTKTKAISGLPIDVKQADELTNDKQHELIKSYIKQALAYDPTKELCQGYNPESDVKFRIGSVYATPYKRQMRIILHNLVRLANANIFKRDPSQILDRLVLDNCPHLTILNRGDDTIQIDRNHDLVLTSKSKLPQMAPDSEIDSTNAHTFIDMYPIFPTVDLKNENVYDPAKPHVTGVTGSNHIHTFLDLNEDDFSTEQDISRLMMFAFGCAYGQFMSQKPDVSPDGRLKKPIVVNGISVLNHRFNFVTYQLNTVDMGSNQGVKNICYYDSDPNNEIYLNRLNKDKLPYLTHKNLQRLAINHLEYNPTVFRKFLAMLSLK